MFPDPRPYFEHVTDPRRDTHSKRHKLGDIFFIIISAVLSGAEDWVAIADFARAKIAWLRRYIELPNGTPSHDTIGSLMRRLDPKEFATCFTRWVEAEMPSLAGEHIAIDGKTLRGSTDGLNAVHMMSAFASNARVILAPQACDGKSNEITAIPQMLDLLDISGATVTIDAMGCQREIAKKIIEGDGEYVLALKGNQPTLFDAVQKHLNSQDEAGSLPEHETIDTGHGRHTIRRCVFTDTIDWLEPKDDWRGIKAVGMIESLRDVKGKVSLEKRYFISSITDPRRFEEVVRKHWAIENEEHWILDVQFGEDGCRARKDHSAENFAIVRRMALNILRKNESNKKVSLKRRIYSSALDDAYRSKMLFGA
jgi:predicted transposase YbfD/YdcC